MSTAKRIDPRTGVPGANKDRGKHPVRGVRIDDELWRAAKVKAESVGTNRNTAVVRLIRGFVDGAIELPDKD